MSQDQHKALDSLKLETSAFKILCYLSFMSGGFTPSQIAELLEEKGSTVRARLAELKSSGLVSSTPNGYVSNITPYDILMKLYRDIKKESGD